MHPSEIEDNLTYKNIFDSLHVGMLTTNNKGDIILANAEAGKLFNLSIDHLLQQKLMDFIPDAEELLLLNPSEERREAPCFRTTGLRNGEQFPLEITVSNSNVGEDNTLVLLLKDITKIKKAEEELMHQAYFDPLTKIPNRTLFEDRSITALNQAGRDKDKVAIIFIDLDGFKEINDTLGHEAGDVMLKEFALRLSDCARISDTVSRHGGDEFTVLMPRIKTKEDAAILANRILESNKQEIKFNGKKLFPKTSIGISIFPSNGTQFDELLHQADSAMYLAKGSGKNTFRFYDSDE